MPNLNAIGIVTADMKRSLDFYRTLGVAAPDFDPAEDHAQCDLGNGFTLMWDTLELIKQITPAYVHGAGSSIGIAFECSSPIEVDATFTRIVEAGFESEKEPWDAFWRQRYAIVKDPDGNAISLYAPM
jgi:uncharacterized glyoxalase superfamily protein PhnB